MKSLHLNKIISKNILSDISTIKEERKEKEEDNTTLIFSVTNTLDHINNLRLIVSVDNTGKLLHNFNKIEYFLYS